MQPRKWGATVVSRLTASEIIEMPCAMPIRSSTAEPINSSVMKPKMMMRANHRKMFSRVKRSGRRGVPSQAIISDPDRAPTAKKATSRPKPFSSR